MCSGNQLHWSCRPAPGTLKSLLPDYGKKWFAASKMQCKFCTGKGHTIDFCPAKPYIPTDKKDRLAFVDGLLKVPRVKTNIFLSMTFDDTSKWIEEKGKQWNKGNPWEGSEKIFDRLRRRLGFWRAIGASDSVISWLGYGVPMPFIKEPKHYVFEHHRMDDKAREYVNSDARKHIESGCFVKAPRGSVMVSNPILCIEQGKKFRRCDDCRHCNALQASPKFKMCSLKTDIPPVVKPGDVQVVRDLEKAYYKVPLAKAAQPYAAFEWFGLFWFSMVMLFGMCQAPFFFTKICRPIVRLFGALKLPAVAFIDDWLWSVKPKRLGTAKEFIVHLFGLLGWSFNDKDQEGVGVKFLGLIVDSVRRQFVAPREKVETLQQLLREYTLAAAQTNMVLRESIQSFLGKLISISIAIPGVRTWCRSLYTQIQSERPAIRLSPASVEELGVLEFLLRTANGSPFIDPTHDVEMWVDSGEIGWGVHTAGVEERGHFPDWAIGTSSTARELLGLSLALSAPRVAEEIRGKVVLLNMDSMCSIRNLVKGGGPVDELVTWIKTIWRQVEELGVTLSPRWQRRNELMMQRADHLSKENTEWTLRESFEQDMRNRWGRESHIPDLSDCQKRLEKALGSREQIVLVFPRWEGKSWWSLAVRTCSSYEKIEDVRQAVRPNGTGYPRWEFYTFVF